ncbi:MAG: carboxypeptidase regulatory-like domain-containing protein, partial [Candidatus Aenigmarchaeota archaeon]|nr:carboxypeptidase regulatory-like domain-containing protein [Candidatus Aenigmarchaeota archaeon]
MGGIRKKGKFLVFLLVSLLLQILVASSLDSVTLVTPPSYENISGVYLLNATTDSHANNVTFYWSNDSGATWYQIAVVYNDTYPDTEFTYSWDSSSIPDGTNLWFNATAMNDSAIVSTNNTNITVDNTPPVISYETPTPLNNSYISGIVVINVSAQDSLIGLNQIQIFIDGQIVKTCSLSPCEYSWNTTLYSDGQHNFTAVANDSLGNENTSLEMRYVIVDNTPPSTTLVEPINGYNSSIASITFNCSATDDIQLKNATLYGNWSGSWHVNETKSMNGTLDWVSFTKTLPEGYYKWNCLVYDASGNYDWGNANYTFLVDVTPPTSPQLLPPSPIDGLVTNETSFTFNWTVTDNIDTLLKCEIVINGHVNATVYTHNNTPISYTLSGFSDGVYVWNITCHDDAGNNATSETRTFTVDTTEPIIYINSPQQNEIINNDTVLLNISITESHPDTLLWELDNNGALIFGCNSCTEFTTYVSGLSDGEHSITIYANDTTGNANISFVNFTIANTRVEVFVFDRYNGLPIKDASVWLNSTKHSFHNTTSSDGIAKFFVDSTKLYNVTVESSGYYANYSFILVNFSTLTRLNVSLKGTARVYGWVKKYEGEPLENATITVYNASSGNAIYQTNSKSNGYFEVWIRGGMTYYVKISRLGYQEKTFGNYSWSAYIYAYLFRDTYGGYLVRVYDVWNKRPVPNANVTITWEYGKANGMTNYAGYVRIEVAANTTQQTALHDFHVSADGYALNDSLKGLSLWEGEEKEIYVYLRGSNKLSGYVTDGMNGRPVKNAIIELWDETNSYKLNWTNTYFYTTTTDDNGHYLIYYPSSFSMNYTTLHVQATGYESLEVSIAGSIEKNITVYGSSYVEGRLVDYYNQTVGICDGTITIKNATSGEVIYTTTSDCKGNFGIKVRGDLTYFIQAYADGYKTYTETSTHSGNNDYGNILLIGKGRVSGKTVDAQNTSITVSNAKVVLKNGKNVYTVYTGSDGSFNAIVRGGLTYTIVLEKQGYEQTSYSEYVSDVFLTDLGNIGLWGRKKINGTILDEKRLYPSSYVNGAKIVLRNDEGNEVYTTTTNSEGFFSLRVPETITDFSVEVEKDGYKTKVLQEYDDLSSINLVGATHVYGRITDMYNGKPVENAMIEVIDENGNVYY